MPTGPRRSRRLTEAEGAILSSEIADVIRMRSEPHAADACLAVWQAVINQAFADLEDQQNRKAALEWFNSEKAGVGSFRWVCDRLRLEQSQTRRRACVTYITSRRRIAGYREEGNGVLDA
jgi:hypothetical protein